jgi:hypothetical protein
MLFAFIFSEKICVAQFVGDVKQENKTEQENKAKQKNETDQDNQPKTYTGLELCSLHDLDKGDVYDFGDEITLYKIGELSNKKPTELTTQMKDGFIVRSVDQGSPADTAKLQKDDIIVSFSGRRFATLEKYETWLKNNITPKISLIVYKRSDDYQKNKTVIITPTAEKPKTNPETNVDTNKTNKNTEKTYQSLEERIKNAKTVPLFEGSSIKEIQDTIQVFGKDSIYSFELPKPYEANKTIELRGLGGKENAILLDGNKLIVIEKDLLNKINEIITATDIQNRESVLKKLLENSYDKEKVIEKEHLAIRLKNAKMVPLFEGSSIKEIQDVLQVFGKRNIYASDLPKPFEAEKTIVPDNGNEETNTILLDGNKLISIKKDTFNDIVEIIKGTDAKDRESVLKKLLQEIVENIYNTKSILETEHLVIRIKNAAVPLFEGSSIKEIQDVQQVFGEKPIYSLPKPYEASGVIQLREYNGKENAILLDGNKLLVIAKDLLNNIREIITATDSKDQETVLKKFLQELSKSKYDGEKTIKKELLLVRLKNAKTEPLFEGSRIKKILDAQNVLGTENIINSDIPKPYKSDDTFLYIKDFAGRENTIVLDENKLIGVSSQTMDYINEVISVITNQEDCEIVLKWLVNSDITKDKIEKDLSCRYKLHDKEDRSIRITIIIDVNRKTINGFLFLNTLAKEWLFADTVRVVDNNGFDWTSGKLKFEHKVFEDGSCYEAVFLSLTNKSTKNIVNSIIQGKGCIIRFYGEKGQRDKIVNSKHSERIKVIYDAYNVLAKTFKESASQQQTSDSVKTKPKSIILIAGSIIIVLFIIGIITVAVIWGVKVTLKNQQTISTENIPPNDTIEFKL